MTTDSLLRTDNEFALVYGRNVNRVYQICYLYLKNRHDAEDAAQSIFEKYIDSNQRFHDERHEKAWFITVSRHYCVDELRKFWKKKRSDAKQMDTVLVGEDNGDDRLTDALLNLPPKYKDALYLYYIEGYSVKEMSKLLHRNESTLRNHLSVGRKLLKIDLGGYYEE